MDVVARVEVQVTYVHALRMTSAFSAIAACRRLWLGCGWAVVGAAESRWSLGHVWGLEHQIHARSVRNWRPKHVVRHIGSMIWKKEMIMLIKGKHCTPRMGSLHMSIRLKLYRSLYVKLHRSKAQWWELIRRFTKRMILMLVVVHYLKQSRATSHKCVTPPSSSLAYHSRSHLLQCASYAPNQVK